MSKRIIPIENWRNDVPVAAPITIQGSKNSRIEIDMLPYLVQGARDLVTGEPDTTVLAERGAQRAWMCDFDVVVDATYGYVTKSSEMVGFVYIPKANFIGVDCFTYRLNNGYQNSETGQVRILVKDSYSINIVIEKRDLGSNAAEFRFVGQYYIPQEFKDLWDDVGMRWYQWVPYKSMLTGRPLIKWKKNLISQTSWDIDGIVNSVPSGVSKTVVSYETGWMAYSWPDTLYGVDTLTNKAYVPPNGPYPVTVEVSFVARPNYSFIGYDNNGLPSYTFSGWNDILSFEYDVRTLGKEWYNDSSVVNSSSLGYTPAVPGPYVPEIVVGNASGSAPVSLLATNPLNGDINVDSTTLTEIKFIFTADVQPGNGNLILYKMSDDSIVWLVDVSSTSNVNFNGNIVSFSIPQLDPNTEYYVLLGNQAIVDGNGNFFNGFSVIGEYSFTTI